MATIPSTKEEFLDSVAKFMEISGNKSYSQENVAGAHKALSLRYLGLQNVTSEELEECAMHYQIATSGAIARGWAL